MQNWQTKTKFPLARAHSKCFGRKVQLFTDLASAKSKLVDINKFPYSHTLKALVITLNCSQICQHSWWRAGKQEEEEEGKVPTSPYPKGFSQNLKLFAVYNTVDAKPAHNKKNKKKFPTNTQYRPKRLWTLPWTVHTYIVDAKLAHNKKNNKQFPTNTQYRPKRLWTLPWTVHTYIVDAKPAHNKKNKKKFPTNTQYRPKRLWTVPWTVHTYIVMQSRHTTRRTIRSSQQTHSTDLNDFGHYLELFTPI